MFPRAPSASSPSRTDFLDRTTHVQGVIHGAPQMWTGLGLQPLVLGDAATRTAKNQRNQRSKQAKGGGSGQKRCGILRVLHAEPCKIFTSLFHFTPGGARLH